MAKAYIEYCLISDQEGSKIPGKCVYASDVDIGTTASTATAPLTVAQFSAGARLVKIQNDDTACYMAIGSTPDPTATTETGATSIRRYISAGAVDLFPLAVGDRVSVIAASPGVGSPMFGRALARAAAAGREARIVVAGHSHVAGNGGGTGSNGLVGAYQAGFVGRLPAKLASRGIAAEIKSHYGDGNVTIGGVTASQWDPRLTLGTGWSSDAAAQTFGGRFLVQQEGGSGYLDFIPGYAFSAARLRYARSASGCSALGVYIDDALFSTLDLRGSNGYIAAEISASGSKISFKNNGTGTAYFCGVEADIGGYASIFNGGWCSGRITDFALSNSTWKYLDGVSAIAGDLGILYAMTNDINAGVAAATWKTSAKTIIQRMQLTGEAIIVVDPPASTFDGTNLSLYGQYETAAIEIAAETGCGLLNLRTMFGSYANSVAQGWQYDNNHPGPAGHDMIAEALAAM